MLINCVAYQNGSRLADLPVEEISDYLTKPGCFVWVALCDATPQELDQMKEEFNLHELAVEDARHGHQRPKIEEYGDSVFAVMHQLELDQGEFSVSEVNVFVGRNFVLSVRNHSKQHFLAVRERCEREPQLLEHGAGFVFYALMDAVVDRYFPIMDGLESELEEIEEQIFGRSSARSSIEQLYALKRKITFLKHAVAPLMEAAGKLFSGRGPVVCANSRDYFRDVYDHLTKINASLDTIRDTIGTAIQVNLSMVTIEESEVNKKLAAWAGIFAVATAFAGIWGMNFKTMPELQWEYGYPVALLTISLTCFFLYTRFKRAGWL
ncbi:magnesium/cobalt transporter CorA [Propionivibrio sp.]|uniref:magnesium/cobalt transporter CorA n=1 Tax=Propionivibrio sp. TaxID=2212460 RepID=UPI0025F46C73|nr:magnesium/cobalt transporter CorA [Propionivibrio sp.]MBK7356885.1 magnesium/cobalt transporter CorA [Propionivibrio sp.]MBK8401684.1 magnesium/cobalt transporter CorA [Propionivibrio sp.]MBK8745044.1 magnesium/cobalt transporter CorA [Propionivibrio sp.]MBK8893906.1 magnesium/cobalt transporter CorA [Propionivibrio sp.]MBL0208187.1 magnesium/cobalt transporter CorA [Propionivibrio sp.]